MRVLAHVVDGGEVAAEVVVQQHARAVGRGVEERQLRGRGKVAFVAEEDLLAGAAIGRGSGRVVGRCAVAGREVGVAGRGEGVVGQVQDRDVDGVGGGAGPVGGHVEGVGRLAVDTSFVEGLPGHIGDESG